VICCKSLAFDRRDLIKNPRWILGATGTVGRVSSTSRRSSLFELTEVAASERSSEKIFRSCELDLNTSIPVARESSREKSGPALDCDFVFFPRSSSSGPAEEEFARAGYPVVSNSKNHRMSPDVSLLIPEETRRSGPLFCSAEKRGTALLHVTIQMLHSGLVLVLQPLRTPSPGKSLSLPCRPFPVRVIGSRVARQFSAMSFRHRRRRRK